MKGLLSRTNGFLAEMLEAVRIGNALSNGTISPSQANQALNRLDVAAR